MRSRPRFERMFALFVKLVLEFEARVVTLRGANGFYDGSDPSFHVPLAKFFGRDGAVAGVMIRESRVPPDSSVEIFGQLHALLILAGFACSAVEVNEIRARDDHIGSFRFAGVHAA